MKNIKYILALLISGALSKQVQAQDLHFSQFNENPSLLNPALTGAAYVVRASAVYKDKWRSITVPYKTFGASIEMKFKPSAWDKVGNHATSTFKKSFNRFAGGLSFYSDKAGDGSMGTTQANLSLATFIPLSSKSCLSIGLQGSVVQKKIDYDKLLWPDQYNGTTYDMSAMAGEDFTSGNFLYPDYAAGLLYTYGYNEKAIGANNQFKLEFGASMYHMSTPKQKFLAETNEKLNSKEMVHGKCLIGLSNSNVSVIPSFLLTFQGNTKETMEGLLLRYNFKQESKYTGFQKGASLYLGGYYRNKDAFIAVIQLDYSQYSIGFSYDINTSKLSKVSAFRGGPEITLRFVTPSPYLFQKAAKAKFI